MSDDLRSPDQIERQIEREREDLASTLDELKSRFTPEAIFGELTRNVRRHGGDVGQAFVESVKQNPLALALTGAGLAWLMMGRSHDEPSAKRTAPARSFEPEDSFGMGDPATIGGARASSGPRRSGGRPGVPVYPQWYDDGNMFSEEDRGGGHEGSWRRDAGGSDGSTADSLRGRADAAATAVGDGARSVGEGVEDAASEVGDAARRAGRSASDFASRTRASLAAGTESLGEEARSRVMAARERAVEARRRATQAARSGYDRGRAGAVDFFEQQPLVAGALAVAVGAAIAGALPRTRKEDEWFGDSSDALMEEAERIFSEERRKAERVAGAALDEAGRIAEEKGPEADSAISEAIGAAVDEAKDAGGRIEQAARDEADRQNLGKIDS